MAVTLIDGTSAAFAAQPEAPEAPKKPAATQAADIASAKVAARLSGKRVEALSERTETSTTWVNKDGSLTTELSAGPVRFERDGEWVDVDVKLRESGGGVEPVAHPNGLVLAGKTGTPAKSLEAAQDAKAVDLVTLGEGDEQISLQWKGGLPAPKLSGTRAEYVNAVPGADVVIEATRTGFEQYVEIKQRPEQQKGFSYTLPLQAEGLKVKQLADGSVLFTDKKNKRRAVMPAPVMWDSTVDELSGEHTRRVPVKMKVVKKKGGAVDLVVTPDAKFLADPETKFPVTVDPSTSSLGNVFDTYVQQGESVDWSNDTELDLGNPGTFNADGTPRYARSFITWDTTPVRDALVKDAKLSLYNFHSGNTVCSPAAWSVWATGAPSTSSRWTNQPEWIQQYATSTETAGRDNCGGDGWINANVTDLVQLWASAMNTSSHMGLRAPSAETTEWKQVNSANAATNPPKLTVTYNFRPKTGTNREAGPPFFSYGGDYTVNTTTPTLRDTFVDADGDTVIGAFQIADSATGSQVGDILTSEFTPSGSPASVKVPSGLLTNGKTYKFRTSPYDGADYNLAWSAWKTFTVDTTAPSAPSKIVSTDYPSDQWVKGEGQAGTFTVTPPSGSDHQGLEWSLDGTTWNRLETGGETAAKNISVTPPKNGTHKLQVRSVDKADNKSEALEYTFHAGPGGFVQPDTGERTARHLPLVTEADATKYDAVSFSWRRSEADSWQTIPAGQVTSGGAALTTWPVPLTGGKNTPLVWNATDTVSPDGNIQVKADFTGPNSATGSTPPLNVVVDRNASGAATQEIGPGTVNLLTGDYTLSGADASAFGLTAGRATSSRRPSTQSEGQFPIFGKEWTSGVVAETTNSGYVEIVKISDTALSVVDRDGSTIGFTADTAKNDWIPEVGAEILTLKGTFTGNFTLTDTRGSETVFAKLSPTATTWVADRSKLNGLTLSTTGVVSEAVTVDGKALARPKQLIAPTSAATMATCTTTPSTRGCRSLEFIYATSTTATAAQLGDISGQVKEIRLWSTEAGATTATAKVVQTYRYNDKGQLSQTWNPQISPALKAEYTYDSAGRVTQLTPPGQLPWNFTYGKAGNAATAGNGMLLKVSRAGLQQGTADVISGTNTTSIVYDVPLTGTAAPHKLGAADVKTWGQTDAPTDATAVFPGDSVPASHSGSALGSADYKRATVHYLGVSGRDVNTAQPGGHITTQEYDRFGNTVRRLSAGNRALALGTAPGSAETLRTLGIASLSSAERAEQMSSVSLFSKDGTRELETLGPLHRVELTEDFKQGSTILVTGGSSVSGRAWTVNEYDKGRPTDGSAVVKDELTSSAAGVWVRGHDSIMGEERVNKTQYDWTKGLPVQTTEDVGGLDLISSTDYDNQGRTTSQSLPGSTGTDAATQITTYWSATGTGKCQGRPEWADSVCWSGPANDITGGGTNPNKLPESTFDYGFYGQVTKKTETANGATRTTLIAYDNAARETKSTLTGPGQGVPDVSTEYDPATGLVIRTTSTLGGTITKAYDKLGRQISYTDADGGVTTTEHDLLNRTVKVTDNAPSTLTYTYDHIAEPRGLATKTTDSVAGSFQTAYDADGSVTSEKLPGGYTLRQTVDTTGSTTNRTYTRDSDNTVIYTDTVTESIHDQVTSHAGWSGQTYRYDDAGRLTAVQDTVDTICTSRNYTFDARSNRTSLTTAASAPGADCSTTGGSTTSHTYDSADRIIDTGYANDAFGRTTSLPDSTIGYYANDLAHQQTSGDKRQTWQLDSAMRFRSWKVEADSGSTWTQTASKLNHYSGDGDSPRWIVEDTATGALTRHVASASENLAATTSKTGDTVLQFTTIHGDVALQLPLDSSVAPLALDFDEYGNARTGQAATRYNWLGAKQRSTETLTGLTLMGVRLYNASTGRFLSIDPIYRGGENAYGYPSDPVNKFDLDGRKVIAKYNKNHFSCGYFACELKLSRKRTEQFIDLIDGGVKAGALATAVAGFTTGAGAALIIPVVAVIIAAGEFFKWKLGYLLKYYPNRGTKIVRSHIGPIYAWHQ